MLCVKIAFYWWLVVSWPGPLLGPYPHEAACVAAVEWYDAQTSAVVGSRP